MPWETVTPLILAYVPSIRVDKMGAIMIGVWEILDLKGRRGEGEEVQTSDAD